MSARCPYCFGVVEDEVPHFHGDQRVTALVHDEVLVEFVSPRLARCSCGRTAPSDPGKMFAFEYRGPGSASATRTCVCGFFEEAHRYDARRVDAHPRLCPTGFKARGPQTHDSYYCGHGGWD